MTIDASSVTHIARLARLAVDDTQVSVVAEQMSRVLALADRLANAPLDGITPMAHPHAQQLVWRDDAVTQNDCAEALLALAPDARAGLYLVPKVIE